MKMEQQEDYVMAKDRPDGLPFARERLTAAGLAEPTTRQSISAAMLQDSGPFRAAAHVVACAKGRNVPMPPPVQPLYARPPQPMPRADGMGFNRDVRDAVNIIGGYSRLQEIAERVLHIKQLTDHRYIFPAGEEDLEQEWFDSNVARLKQILEDIPVKLTVELGRTKLTIKQLLELAQGSVIELEGLAGEPMDILINGYLIAQGEVVVIEDKYGIRITEIITPSERIHKLNR